MKDVISIFLKKVTPFPAEDKSKNAAKSGKNVYPHYHHFDIKWIPISIIIMVLPGYCAYSWLVHMS